MNLCDVVCPARSRKAVKRLRCAIIEGRCVEQRSLRADRCGGARAVVIGRELLLDTGPAHHDYAGSCGGLGPDLVYRVHVPIPSRLRAKIRSPYGSALYLRRSCIKANTELGCARTGPKKNHLDVNLSKGDYYLFVDGACHRSGPNGLTVELDDRKELAASFANAPLLSIGKAVYGSTVQGHNWFSNRCGRSSGYDKIFRLKVPQRSQWRISVAAKFRVKLYLLPTWLGQPQPLACGEHFRDRLHGRVHTTLESGDYYVIVDGRDRYSKGEFDIRVEKR